MKETFYFSHDYNARNDPKLQRLMMERGLEGLGAWWCIVEMLYEQNGKLPLSDVKMIAFALHTQPELIEDLIQNSGLFEHDEECFWSASVLRRVKERDELREKRSKGAQRTNELRWANRSAIANESLSESSTVAINKIKEKENKEKEIDNTPLSPNGEKASVKKFIPPTEEEVRAEIEKHGYHFSAQTFVAFYDSKGWMVGKNKMKDWRRALVTWETSRNGRNQQACANSNLGIGEYITADGRRTYGSGEANVPMNAPKRPNNQCCWDSHSQGWVM